MAEPKDRPLHDLLSRDMVDIYVGPENTHWILHEKLLCHRSKFFRDIFYTRSERRNTAFGLPDEDEEAFRLFVGWLYSASVPTPKEEKHLGALFDLYLMGEHWAIKGLMVDVLDAVRRFYADTQTYPGLRRVQYIYAETQPDSPMRQLLVASVARYLVLGDGIPAHWDKALRKNGQLAVDIILAVQKWKIDEDKVPDPRAEPVEPSVQEALDKGAVRQEEVPADSLPNGVEDIELNDADEVDEATQTDEQESQALESKKFDAGGNLTNGVHDEEDDEEEDNQDGA